MLFALHKADDGSRESIAMPKIFNSCSNVMRDPILLTSAIYHIKVIENGKNGFFVP